jgi:hypothetical protein
MDQKRGEQASRNGKIMKMVENEFLNSSKRSGKIYKFNGVRWQ